MQPILELKQISKFFNNICVVDHVDFSLQKGEVHALLGENGAGKSTLMKIIMGEHESDNGEIHYNGSIIKNHSPGEALSLGIAMIHQELNSIPHISITDFLCLGREFRKFKIIPDIAAMQKFTREQLNYIGFDIDPGTMMGELTVSELQMVEIAKVISYGSKVLILDEPTSSLTEREADRLFEIIENLKSKDVAIVYISHRLEEIDRIADKVTVLMDGKVTVSTDIGSITREQIIEKMVGREITDIFKTPNTEFGEELLRAEGITWEGRFKDISFSVRSGEVLGFAGLIGAGRTEVATAIFGEGQIDSGDVFVRDNKVKIKNAVQSIRHGIVYATEDRKLSGLNLKGDVQDNITQVYFRDICKGSLVREKRLFDESQKVIRKLNVKVRSPKDKVVTLSGGNQQKVAIGKWLVKDPEIIILDEPTRGIDVGAKAEIYKLIHQLSLEGKAIIIISSEMQEIVGLCNRVLVLYEGRTAGILERHDISEINIMKLAAGSKQ